MGSWGSSSPSVVGGVEAGDGGGGLFDRSIHHFLFCIGNSFIFMAIPMGGLYG